MNLTVSPYNAGVKNSPSFGMAKFSLEGLQLAQSCSDTCDFLDSPIEFQDAAYFEKKKFLRKAPFAKYIEKTLPAKKSSNVTAASKVAKVIVDCGTSKNAFANARFIRQLLTTKNYVQSLDDTTKDTIGTAVRAVFEANWNNPELTKAETMELLEFSSDALDDKQYVTLTGVIEKSDAHNYGKK